MYQVYIYYNEKLNTSQKAMKFAPFNMSYETNEKFNYSPEKSLSSNHPFSQIPSCTPSLANQWPPSIGMDKHQICNHYITSCYSLYMEYNMKIRTYHFIIFLTK